MALDDLVAGREESRHLPVTIYVGNLPRSASITMLWKFLEERIGPVNGIRKSQDGDCAFVLLASNADFERALRVRRPTLDGRRLKLGRARVCHFNPADSGAVNVSPVR